MALDGGGGGGGLVGVSNSFTGASQSLEIAGDFCYSYSGVVAVDNLLVVMNSFTTGNYLSIIALELHGAFAQIGTNQTRLEVKLNGAQIINSFWDPTLDSAYTMLEQRRLIIPAYTEVEVSLSQATGAGNPRNMETTITGRIYR